jgi:hypothetical protein
MLFTPTGLTAALTLLLTSVCALPTTDTAANPFKILLSEKVPAGTLIWYGYETETTSSLSRSLASLLPRACGTNNVFCDTNHSADAQVCANLISTLSQFGSDSVPQSPRSICLIGNAGARCCVSWANAVPGLVKSNLVNAATAALNGCRTPNAVSALTRNTLLQSTCTTQCLSDRPNGCTNREAIKA